MKNFKLVFLAIIIIATANSCKKGEDDPFFSLQSRKKRISKEWVLIEGNYTSTSTFENETHEVIYTQTKDSLTHEMYEFSITSDYIETINLNEDGTFIISSKSDNYFSLGELSGTTTGTWEFLSSEGEYKNRERIKLIPESSASTFMGNTTTEDYRDKTISQILQLTRLSKDELNFDFIFTMQDGITDFESNGSKKFIEK